MALFTFPRRTDPADRRSPTGLDGRDFLLLIVATLGTFSNYAPLLSVVSLWSAEGGSGHGGVGAATGVTMATTVGIQLVMSRLLRRYGLRRILAAGALLLGLPTFAYPVSSGLEWVLAVSAVRGVGFGMVAVAGSALVAELVPPGQRGRAVGRYGIAVGLPQVVCLPAGVWCAQQFGFTAVFVVTGAASVLAAPLAGLMSGRRAEEQEEGHAADEAASSGRERPGQGGTSRPEGGLRPLAGPWTMLIVSACALGGMTSFLPLALEGDAAAPTALFVLSAAVIAGRWVAGRPPSRPIRYIFMLSVSGPRRRVPGRRMHRLSVLPPSPCASVPSRTRELGPARPGGRRGRAIATGTHRSRRRHTRASPWIAPAASATMAASTRPEPIAACARWYTDEDPARRRSDGSSTSATRSSFRRVAQLPQVWQDRSPAVGLSVWPDVRRPSAGAGPWPVRPAPVRSQSNRVATRLPALRDAPALSPPPQSGRRGNAKRIARSCP